MANPNRSAGYFAILVWVFLLHVIGALLFTRGFLLKRLVVEQNSTCDVDFATPLQADMLSHGHGQPGCWMHRRYKRAVVVLIDALRFDFVLYNSSLAADETLPYQNKLKTIHNLLQTKPRHSRLYQFQADPPTTTMQRLKGMTTGSLPTFVDTGANFAGTEITEDNIIDQLIKAKKRLTFMGDDTWVALFPNKFHKSFPFPSFNVKDLHTVDNGVIKHLMPEMKNRDWDVLIAHFLGVDHCGHRYGPYHDEMAAKLTQMDEVIRTVVNSLEDDTILFVLGDHGMTKTGDHGGDSQDELDAALFVYSPSQLTSSSHRKGHHEHLSQVDLVPTFSLLLGLPVPFSNLGTIVPELFSHCPWWKSDKNKIKPLFHEVKALRLNAHQVRQYLQAYSNVSDEFPYQQSRRLDKLFIESEENLQELVTSIQLHGDIVEDEILKDLKRVHKKYVSYLSDVKAMCKDIWAKFDLGVMLLGTCTFILAYTLGVYCCRSISYGDPFQKIAPGILGSFWSIFLIVFLSFTALPFKKLTVALLCGLLIIGVFVFILTNIFTLDSSSQSIFSFSRFRSLWKPNIVPVLMMLAYAVSLSSNSFAVYEDLVTTFLLQSTIWYFCAIVAYQVAMERPKQERTTKSSKKGHKFDIGRLLTSPHAILMYIVLTANMCVRLSRSFLACREEQWECELSPFVEPISSFSADRAMYRNIRYFSSVACAALLPIALQKWMRHYGNLNGYSPMILGVSYGLPLAVVCMSLHWALQALPNRMLDSLPVWQVVTLPRIVFVTTIAMIVCFIADPLCLFVVSRDKERVPHISRQEDMVPSMYNHVKANWKKYLGSRKEGEDDIEETPVVYGLATVYSSSLLALVGAVVVVLVLLIGDGMVIAVALQLVVMFLVLELNAVYMKLRGGRRMFEVPWLSVFAWGLIASHFFFATGHQASVLTIRWEAAYIGFHGDFENYVIPAVLIILNMFVSHILCILTLPLLILWPMVRGEVLFTYESRVGKSSEGGNKKGEFVLHEEEGAFKWALFKLCGDYTTFSGTKLLAAMITAAIHRRHLMVWKIFAPRFVFEGATFLLCAALIPLTYLAVMRIHSALSKWVTQIEKRS